MLLRKLIGDRMIHVRTVLYLLSHYYTSVYVDVSKFRDQKNRQPTVRCQEYDKEARAEAQTEGHRSKYRT